MAISNLLKDVFFFKGFSAQELKQVESICERKKYPAGTQIFFEGEEAARMYLIEIGTVHLTHDEKEVAVIGKGGMFGEMPFLDGENRSATATTVEESHLIEISYQKLTRHLLKHPETALKFYMVAARYVSKRLRSLIG